MMQMIKAALQPAPPASWALLLLRLVVGTAFIIHGWQRSRTRSAGRDLESPVPGLFQFLAALSEFGGGIAWILGLLTPLAALGIGCTMTVAVFMHSMVLHDPFVSLTGGRSYELASAYLCIALLLLALGPGRFSLDANVFGERK